MSLATKTSTYTCIHTIYYARLKCHFIDFSSFVDCLFVAVRGGNSLKLSCLTLIMTTTMQLYICFVFLLLAAVFFLLLDVDDITISIYY